MGGLLKLSRNSHFVYLDFSPPSLGFTMTPKCSVFCISVATPIILLKIHLCRKTAGVSPVRNCYCDLQCGAKMLSLFTSLQRTVLQLLPISIIISLIFKLEPFSFRNALVKVLANSTLSDSF